MIRSFGPQEKSMTEMVRGCKVIDQEFSRLCRQIHMAAELKKIIIQAKTKPLIACCRFGARVSKTIFARTTLVTAVGISQRLVRVCAVEGFPIKRTFDS